jgi:hypothetical protein
MGATLDRLHAEFYSVNSPGVIGGPPYTVADMNLRAGHWRTALDIMRRYYDPETARSAWVELLARPGSGWERNGEVYCVPGYDMLCGDAISADDWASGTRPAGLAVPEVARAKWVWIGGAAVAAWVAWRILR